MKARLSIIIICTAILFNSCSDKGTAKQSDNYRNYYEIFVRSFYDSDGDGIGDLKGVTSKLDYISKDLGADGIWLMPIMPSPSYHKYNVTNYYAIDPQYGTMDDFDELMQETDKRDIKVIIDLVVNHTSDMMPWFRKAVEGLWDEEENEYTRYYNFTTEYSGSGYTKITAQYYYEARFSPDMPDLNLDNEAVRSEILNIAKFWIDRGVDGFRLDAVTSYYTGNDTKNTEFMKWLNDSVKAYKPDAYFVGEAWTTASSIADYYSSGIDSFFNFPFSQVDGTIVKNLNAQNGKILVEQIYKWKDTIKNSNSEAIDAPFLSNHDNARSAGFLMRNMNKKKMAASIYLLMPGNPFIYYGEEIGMTGSGNDPNKRLPMLWSTTELVGIPYNPPGATQSISDLDGVDVQMEDKNSLLNFYKEILTIKKRFPGIARGEMTRLDTQNPEICAYTMTWDNRTVLVMHNLSECELSEDLETLHPGKVKIRSSLLCDPDNSAARIEKGLLTLPPCSTTILQ
jgi:alpha-amylase